MKLTHAQILAVIVFAAVVAICLLSGCEGDEESLERRARVLLENNKHRVSSILYVYDPRVDICYAVYRLGYREGTMTVVPYEKVKHLAQIVKYEGMDITDWERHRERLGMGIPPEWGKVTTVER